MTSPSNSEQNVRSGEISEKNVDMFKKNTSPIMKKFKKEDIEKLLKHIPNTLYEAVF